jgi:hypothetical protein
LSHGTTSALCAAAIALGACASTPHQPQPRRAALISLDALSEARVRELPRDIAPNLHALFDGGACAAYAVPSFPSVTAAGHAAIATGAWGHINGVSANSQPVLPRDRHRVTQMESGYSAGPLRAEPIWITAALAGLDVVSHHFTQAPQPPGHRPETTAAATPWPAWEDGGQDVVIESGRQEARRRAEQALAMPGVAVMNGYNRVLSSGSVVTHATAATRPAQGWSNLHVIPAGSLPTREATWQVLDDSVFALFYGSGRYTHARIALSRNAAEGVEVAAVPADTTSLTTRPLARWFSQPLRLSSEGGRVFLSARLFELSDDGTSFLLFHPPLSVVETNRTDIDAEYDAAVPGWAGSGAYRREADEFGLGLADGGDGTAEARYLETLEYATLQFMRGSEWAWRTRGAQLLVDYFPVGDQVDHALYGWVTPETPGHDPLLAARYARFHHRAWQLVDMRLGHLKQLVGDDANTALFVTGDHGMRPYWRVFRPNVVLQQGGLQALDDEDRPLLHRTRALAPTAFWISVNHDGWRDGIVPQDSINVVLAAAERALLAARGVDGERVVTRTWRVTPALADSLGIGGPVAGELYFEVAPGYMSSTQHTGGVASDVRRSAGHGFPSTAPDMHTALCGWGSALPAVRTGGARIIDAAPTVAEWLGIPAPPQSQGRSQLPGWLRR